MRTLHVADGCREITTFGKLPWFALRVRTRHEWGVADFLRGMGYQWFLPTYKCKRHCSDRIKVVEAPLFPGYLFCQFNPQQRLPILKTPGVIQIVGCSQTPMPIDDSEIQALQLSVKSGLPNLPCPFLTVGERVQIESGPLRGLEGILVAMKGKHRLVLSVTLLQRSVAVEVDSGFVRRKSASSAARIENVGPQRYELQLAY